MGVEGGAVCVLRRAHLLLGCQPNASFGLACCFCFSLRRIDVSPIVTSQFCPARRGGQHSQRSSSTVSKRRLPKLEAVRAALSSVRAIASDGRRTPGLEVTRLVRHLLGDRWWRAQKRCISTRCILKFVQWVGFGVGIRNGRYFVRISCGCRAAPLEN